MQFSVKVCDEAGGGAGGGGDTFYHALLLARSSALRALEQMNKQRDAQVQVIAAIDGTLAALGHDVAEVRG